MCQAALPGCLPPARPPAPAPYITPQAYTLPHCLALAAHTHIPSPPQAEAQLTPWDPPAADREGLKAPRLPAPCPGEPLACGDMNCKLVPVHGVRGQGGGEGGKDWGVGWGGWEAQ